jgi:hypothetical protein
VTEKAGPPRSWIVVRRQICFKTQKDFKGKRPDVRIDDAASLKRLSSEVNLERATYEFEQGGPRHRPIYLPKASSLVQREDANYHHLLQLLHAPARGGMAARRDIELGYLYG